MAETAPGQTYYLWPSGAGWLQCQSSRGLWSLTRSSRPPTPCHLASETPDAASLCRLEPRNGDSNSSTVFSYLSNQGCQFPGERTKDTAPISCWKKYQAHHFLVICIHCSSGEWDHPWDCLFMRL